MRFPDWPKRLRAFLTQADARPFSWGQWDCLQFVRGAVSVQTGAELLDHPHWQQPYNDALSAEEALHYTGYSTVLEFADALLREYPKIGAQHAQRGDIILMSHAKLPLKHAFGVIGLDGWVRALTECGLTRFRVPSDARAWRIS